MVDEPDANPWPAEEYAALAGFDGDWRDDWWNRDYLALLAERLRLRDARRVLDVGCGAGHWGQLLAGVLAPDAHVVGVDREPAFLPMAERNARARGLPQTFEYVVGDAMALPFEDGRFDLVTAQTVLMHVADASRAVAEMVRVLAPAGLVLACEPNNMANAMVELTAAPRQPWSVLEPLLRFQLVCEEGKRRLGHGDDSVGELLPGYFVEAGLEDVRVSTNDRTGTIAPPYTGRQREELARELEWIEQGIWPAAGTADDARRLFEAGGGDPCELEPLWDAVVARGRRFREGVEAGTFHGGRGFVQYVVSGRRPAGPVSPA